MTSAAFHNPKLRDMKLLYLFCVMARCVLSIIDTKSQETRYDVDLSTMLNQRVRGLAVLLVLQSTEAKVWFRRDLG